MPFLIFLLLLLSSCGGGGGGGGGGGSSSPSSSSWTSSIITSEADVYRTSEYNAQAGLEKIHAAEAYALLAKNSKTVAGSGVKIAIVDTGVKTSHVEISSNYSSSGSHDYVNGDSDPSDDNGHGTHVSSTAAGVKDGSGIHGVAYQSTIIAEKVLNSSGNGTDANVANGINNAVSAGAKVINLSLGGSASSNIRNALIAAKSADILSVAATGNLQVGETDADRVQPNYPARYAADSSLLGYVLAVAAVDTTGGSPTIASFSYYCGDAQNYCLVAPGVDIYAAYTTSTYAYADGTSMATPHVAGAAAVIRGAWPHLSAAQTAQILLQTTTDLGDPGVDAIYGHGMLNLYAAVQAQGQNTLGYGTSMASGGYELASSSLSSSAIFGDAFSYNVVPQLSEAIFFDDFGRDYKANLSEKININAAQNSLNSVYFLSNNISSKTLPIAFGSDFQNKIKLNLSSYKNSDAPNIFGLKFGVVDHAIDPQKNLNNGFSFVGNAAEISPNLKFGFSFNLDEISAIEAKEFGNFGFILQNNFASNPYQSFFRSASQNLQNSRKFNQVFAAQDFFNKKFALKFSYQSSYDSSQILNKITSKQNEVFDFGLDFKIKNDAKFLVSFGNLTEFQNNILNSKSLGAFESNGDVKTSYVKFSLSQNLAKDLQIIGSFSEGFSKINGNQNGIFRDFNNVRSRSSSIALVHNNFLKGQVGVSYLQPLRVYRGVVQYDIPIARDLDGNLARLQGFASLVPQGKERDLEIFYLRNLDEDSSLKFNLVQQKDAGNIKGNNQKLAIINYIKAL